MANRKFKIRAALIGAGLLAPFCAWVLAAEDSGDAAGSKTESSALVTTAALHQGPISTTVSGYGTVVGVPGKAKNLTFAQAGLVSEVRVSVGEAVKRGTTILAVTTDPAGRLAYEQAQTGLDFARSELDRIKQLRAQNLATDSQVAAAEKGLHDAEATLIAQQQLGTAAAQSELKAPFDGVVLDIPVALGDRTTAGAVLARMVPADAVQVLVGLAPADARRVKVGMAASLKSVSTDGEAVDGKVTHVQAMLNPQTHLIDVAVQPTARAAGAALLPSEAAEASITLSTANALLAPRAAVLTDENGTYLFQVVDDHAKRVKVTTGAENDQEVAVSGELDGTRKVVVLGAYELEDGMAVHESEDGAKDDKADDKADNKADEKGGKDDGKNGGKDEKDGKDGGDKKDDSKAGSKP
jgi:RND family efflux transporter MFP subunit